MAATPLEHPDLAGPGGVLAALEATHGALSQHEIGQFRLAVEWAIMHPIESVADIATVEGTEGELAIAGPGAPLVAEFCVADFAPTAGPTRDIPEVHPPPATAGGATPTQAECSSRSRGRSRMPQGPSPTRIGAAVRE